MLAHELITNTIVPLKTSDTGMLGLSLMEEYKVTHLPIVNAETYIGLISEDDIYSYNRFEEAIGGHPIANVNISVHSEQHLFEVLELIHEHHLTLVPVVDQNEIYLGSILVSDLAARLAKITSLSNPGGIIVLMMNIHDYSLSEIAQIVETNNIKILNLFVSTFAESTKIEVTIKLNSIDIEPVLQTFSRYNYEIKASYTETELNESLTERYDSLMNYLNI
ncbi:MULTISPECIES: CBS domain-containing protein [unclassified Lentimicrobium]|uniref:CBS domain-containing protein n=1 Tax=unclassified Lentimicrobium TaxID=2677434 RepID=UPI001557D4A5|nr:MULTISPECIES: CBS domain-containing protein [unclassified Lentimicrobium]NPD44235.1 CBS domain-containing protein [Lentimicrobium sp. S6]NPD85773.1 CBS domain-containing protein [Lentimicrobium sp. L6]